MITFWIFAIAMVIIALIFLIRPFFLDMKKDEIARSALNVKITKERIAELEIELAQETISQDEYEQSREELEQALLYDVEQESSKTVKVNNDAYNRFTRISLLFVVPLFAVGIYAYLGEPSLIEGGQKQTAATSAAQGSSKSAASTASVEEMVEKLAAKLKTNPDNAEGWYMLARSYMSMKRYPDAVLALEKTNKLVPNNPTIMLRYADALIMTNGGKMSGKPFELVKKAIAMKPDDPTGLWLIGMGYEEQGNYKKAVSYWNLLLALLQDEKSISEVKRIIKQAQIKGGLTVTESSVATSTGSDSAKKKEITSLKINVSIDKSQLKNVSMDDTVFIFAKALSGPPMPLAVARKQVKDLPIQITLDDTMAMIPSMKLSSFDKVKITARVSKTGKPLLQKGDIYSQEKHVTLPHKGLIEIEINTVAE